MPVMNRWENEETNFYLMLELDFKKPEVTNEEIIKAYKKKREELNPKRNTSAEARKLLELLAESVFNPIMLTDGPDRKREAKAAMDIAHKKLDAIVASYCVPVKTTAKVSHLKTYLEKDNQRKYRIALEELVEALKQKGVPVEEEKSPVKNEFSKAEKLLKFLNQKNLYEFLAVIAVEAKFQEVEKSGWGEDIVKQLSKDKIQTTCNQIYKRYNDMPKKTERNNAVKNLAMACLEILCDPEKRKKYDAFISGGKKVIPQIVIDRIELLGIDSSISAEEAKALILTYQKSEEGRGLSVDEIKEILKEEFIKRKIYDYEFPDISVSKNEIRWCKVCGIMMKSTDRHCPSCGTAVFIKCFNCGKEIESGSKNCPSCGSDLQGKVLAENECKAARKCLSAFDFSGARECIRRAKGLWPNCPEIPTLEKEITTGQEEAEKQINAIESLIKRKAFVEAQTVYATLTRRVAGYSNTVYENKINSAIRESAQWLAKAKASLSNEEKMIDYCTKALEICEDLQEARMLMIKYPPQPASNIRVVTGKTGNMISWTKSPSGGNVTYKVLKGEGVVPKLDTQDPKVSLLTETSATQFEDKQLVTNVPVYYAVYTYRAGISAVPIFNDTAVFNFLDVKDLVVEEGNACVNLSWKMPDKAELIEVFQKEGSPITAYGDGTCVATTRDNHYSDVGLQNEKTYYYGVFATYKTAKGTVRSAGEYVKGFPSLPPEKVKQASLSKCEGGFSFSWMMPPKGTVEIVYGEKTPYDSGTVLSLSQIRKSFFSLPVVARSENSVRFKSLGEGVYYLCPVTVVGQMGVLGDYYRISTVADFSNLQVPRMVGNSACILFDWNCGATEAVLLCKIGGYPNGPEDPMASKLVVKKEAFNVDKALTVHDLGKNDYYFALYASYGDGIYSSGLKTVLLNGTQGQISFHVEIEKNLFRTVKGVRLTIEAEHLNVLPRMILCKKNGTQPVSKGDGIIVGVIESTSQRKASYFFADTQVGDKTKFQLFFDNDELYSRIQLRRR